MINFQIDTLPLVTNSIATTGYILQTPIKGLEAPQYRNTSTPRPGQNGSRMTGQFYGSRIVDLTGLVHDQRSALNYESLRQQLISAVSIKKDSNGTPIPTRVTFTTLAGINYFFDAFFDTPELPHDLVGAADFQLVGEVTSPFIFLNQFITTGNISVPTGGGYVVPMILPYTSTSSTGGSVTVNNPGQVDTPPTITLVGPLTSPTINNQTTGMSLQLNYTIPSGSTATIDMGNQLITLNSSSSLIGAKTTASNWWFVAKGSNTFSLQTNSGSDTGYASVGFYPAYIGV